MVRRVEEDIDDGCEFSLVLLLNWSKTSEIYTFEEKDKRFAEGGGFAVSDKREFTARERAFKIAELLSSLLILMTTF